MLLSKCIHSLLLDNKYHQPWYCVLFFMEILQLYWKMSIHITIFRFCVNDLSLGQQFFNDFKDIFSAFMC